MHARHPRSARLDLGFYRAPTCIGGGGGGGGAGVEVEVEVGALFPPSPWFFSFVLLFFAVATTTTSIL